MLKSGKISPIVMSDEGATESNNATRRNEENSIVTAIIEEDIPHSANVHFVKNDANQQEQPNSEGIDMKTLEVNAISTSPQDAPEPIAYDAWNEKRSRRPLVLNLLSGMLFLGFVTWCVYRWERDYNNA